MRRSLLICVLLAVMLAEASCFFEGFEVFMNDLSDRVAKLSSLACIPGELIIVRGCVVPEPPNGAKIVGGYPGQIVGPAFRLTYSCTDGYIMSGSEISICTDGMWHMTPTCLRSQDEEPPQDVNYSLISPRIAY